MGAYLNSQTPYTLYQSESRSPYFVDKTMLLQELFPYVAAGNRHLCVTRPRRFGKTIAANMISSFFQKGIDSGELFDRLKISEADDCQKYKNKYNVIRIDFSKMPRNCESYRQYIERVEELLISDLREAYPDAKPVKQMRLEIFWKRSFNSIMAKNLFLFWTNGILFFTGDL